MDIIKRNIPVFVIGTITLLLFVGIIIAGQKNPPPSQQPVLKPANEQELIKEHTYILGSYDAPITLVEFSDYECPACKAFQPAIKSLYENNSGLLRVAYRHYPLPQHPYARKAALAAQAAGIQNKFWEYSAILYENNTKLTDSDLINYAKEVGLDIDKFKEDSASSLIAAQVNSDIQDANGLNLSFTPTFFLNGKPMEVANSQDFQSQVILEINKIKNIEVAPEPETTSTDSSGLEIKYTNEGFSPKAGTGYLNKKVTFINKTDKTITIEQTEIKFEEFGAARVLAPGETYEMVFTKDKMWNFREKESGDTGSVFIY